MRTFHLPDLGEGLQEAEIVAWHVEVGDRVKPGDPLVSVETDKAVVEIPAPFGGTVSRVFGAVGDHLPVGSPLAIFGKGADEATKPLVGLLPGITASGKQASSGTLPDDGPPPRAKALPAVRARARELGIDLSSIAPSGPDGSVTTNDLERAAARKAAGGEMHSFIGKPLRGPRRAMARNMARAGAEVVPATVTDEVVVDHWNAKTDITGELVLAVVEASRAEPALNAWYDGSKITRKLHRHVDLGIAMDTPEGLFVPVLRQAETKSAAELRAEIDRLKQAVALRQVAPSELAEASLTLSNFGLLGGRHAALVVVPPQVAIVGAGKVAPSVVPIRNRATVRMTLPLSLTFDHRAVTGGEAARFLAQLVKVLSHGH